ncbi:hypothetical protein M427DRAFT_40674 [Gonapodya prolifera JEL478]|uniref:Uncharacterized protein n=1 Tax=Gonapodya prolifera (strain JEL478) TaxID=1344416 RepID=A0A139AYV6_GONPJ|nr:hypothetical protein M427DRAFT_40674 [Gonapodya prolifera JEL478]|eukprot:KXS21894.1 hypothetical protein M427DRAFT_40674 [Gonapodya prolifera JEL478]
MGSVRGEPLWASVELRIMNFLRQATTKKSPEQNETVAPVPMQENPVEAGASSAVYRTLSAPLASISEDSLAQPVPTRHVDLNDDFYAERELVSEERLSMDPKERTSFPLYDDVEFGSTLEGLREVSEETNAGTSLKDTEQFSDVEKAWSAENVAENQNVFSEEDAPELSSTDFQQNVKLSDGSLSRVKTPARNRPRLFFTSDTTRTAKRTIPNTLSEINIEEGEFDTAAVVVEVRARPSDLERKARSDTVKPTTPKLDNIQPASNAVHRSRVTRHEAHLESPVGGASVESDRPATTMSQESQGTNDRSSPLFVRRTFPPRPELSLADNLYAQPQEMSTEARDIVTDLRPLTTQGEQRDFGGEGGRRRSSQGSTIARANGSRRRSSDWEPTGPWKP